MNRARLYEFWRRNQLVILHAPVLAVGAFVVYSLLRGVDPYLGIEGFGDLMGYALAAVRAALIVYSAWWVKRWALFDLHASTELELFKMASSGHRGSERVLIRDRLEWAFLLALFAWIYSP